MPQVWDLPLTSTGNATPPPPQGQDKSSTYSRSPTPSPTSATIGLGPMPKLPPQMQRGVTAPCTSSSTASSRSFEGRAVDDRSSQARKENENEKEDLEQERQDSSVFASAGASGQGQGKGQGEERRPRGRVSAREWSKSLSPKGRLGNVGARSVSVEGARERSRPASPKRSHVSVCECVCV